MTAEMFPPPMASECSQPGDGSEGGISIRVERERVGEGLLIGNLMKR